AARGVADQKLSLFAGQRSAAAVLSLLARHLDYRWTPRAGGYELGQSLDAAKREARFRTEDRAAKLAQLDARMRRIAQLAALPPACGALSKVASGSRPSGTAPTPPPARDPAWFFHRVRWRRG